jgi:hypothetical protein
MLSPVQAARQPETCICMRSASARQGLREACVGSLTPISRWACSSGQLFPGRLRSRRIFCADGSPYAGLSLPLAEHAGETRG